MPRRQTTNLAISLAIANRNGPPAPIVSCCLLWSAAASSIPRLRTTPIFKMRLQQGFATGEMGGNGHFAQQQSQRLMSAPGQNATCAHAQVMSSLTSLSDIDRRPPDSRSIPTRRLNSPREPLRLLPERTTFGARG